MSNELTISTLPIQTAEKLTGDARTRLVRIVEQEFINKESLYHQIQEEEKNKVIAAYHKKVGFPKLLTVLEGLAAEESKIEERKKQIKEKIKALGLGEDGDPRKSQNFNREKGCYVTDYEAKELNTLLQTIENNGPTQNLKNKLITRITLATTIGEANVIMHEVLGNGLIPALKIGDLK